MGSEPKARTYSWRATSRMSSKIAARVPLQSRKILGNHLLPTAPRQDYLAALLQPSDDRHDALLGLLHRAQPDRAHEFDLLFQHVARALGHVLEDPAGHFFVDTLQRQAQLFDLHLAQDLL